MEKGPTMPSPIDQLDALNSGVDPALLNQAYGTQAGFNTQFETLAVQEGPAEDLSQFDLLGNLYAEPDNPAATAAAERAFKAIAEQNLKAETLTVDGLEAAIAAKHRHTELLVQQEASYRAGQDTIDLLKAEESDKKEDYALAA